MSEKYSVRKRLAAAGLVLLGGASLSACGDEAPDYVGAGNEFMIRGIVSDSEVDGLVQIKEDKIEIIQVSGKAENWFNNGDGVAFLHDEFDFLQKYGQEPGGFWTCADDVYVGKVYDQSGNQIEPEQLRPGEVVEIEGRIHQSTYRQSAGKSSYCTEEELAVYDSVTVVDEPLHR
jgi:hypothetical protein